ncbi:SCO2322 family protein [Nonomuraea sp. LPB2021202275-12-8]|uniref:SCO2322 family protein n=1 Tax=Nonomuraea sp. LPB2021202275-12-8 TaxID=3120159 RepID=UPI00300D17F6
MLRAYLVAAGAVLGAAALLSSPTPASASTGRDPGAARLWSVWQSDGTAWLGTTARDVPPDGSVVGWRFAASPDGTASEPPGGDQPAFQAVCGMDTAASGHKRVVVVVDFGDADSDAYPGDRPPAGDLLECVTAAEDATSAQLLASAARTRANTAGDVVSIDGYPAKERGGSDLGAAEPAAAPSGGPPLTLLLAGAGALALLGGGTVVATRRRSRSPARRSP